jgi:hypothetical protein
MHQRYDPNMVLRPLITHMLRMTRLSRFIVSCDCLAHSHTALVLKFRSGVPPFYFGEGVAYIIGYVRDLYFICR